MESRLFACINFGFWKCQNDSRTPKRVASDQLFKIQCKYIIKTYKPRTWGGGGANNAPRADRDSPGHGKSRTCPSRSAVIVHLPFFSLAVYFCTPARGRLPTGTHTVELPFVLATDVLTSY